MLWRTSVASTHLMFFFVLFNSTILEHPSSSSSSSSSPHLRRSRTTFLDSSSPAQKTSTPSWKFFRSSWLEECDSCDIIKCLMWIHQGRSFFFVFFFHVRQKKANVGISKLTFQIKLSLCCGFGNSRKIVFWYYFFKENRKNKKKI